MKVLSCQRCRKSVCARYRARSDRIDLLLCSPCAAEAWQEGFSIEVLVPRAVAKLRPERSFPSGRRVKNLHR